MADVGFFDQKSEIIEFSMEKKVGKENSGNLGGRGWKLRLFRLKNKYLNIYFLKCTFK